MLLIHDWIKEVCTFQDMNWAPTTYSFYGSLQDKSVQIIIEVSSFLNTELGLIRTLLKLTHLISQS